MKKLFLIIVGIILIFTGTGLAGECFPGDTETASALILTGPGRICSLVFNTDGTNDVTLNLYDNTAASVKKLLPTDYLIKTSSTNREHTIEFRRDEGYVGVGIYVSISTSGSVNYMVYFENK